MTRRSAGQAVRVLMVDAANQTPGYVYPLCAALAAQDCHVELATAPFVYAPLPPPPVPVHEDFAQCARWPLLRSSQPIRQVVRGLEYPFDWTRVMRRIARLQPDIVHIQWAMLPPVDALAFCAIRASGARLVYTAHDIRPRYGRLRRVLLSTRRLYRLADHLVVHSRATQQQLGTLSGLPSTRISVIPHGNAIGWSDSSIPQAAARRWLGLPDDAPVALFFGVVKPYKGLDVLLHAMREVLRVLPAVRLIIAGRPEGSFAPYQQLVDELGIAEPVMSHLAFIQEADVAKYFAAADVVVLPYRDSDASGVLLRAYTSGRPVIVSPVDGLAELVDQGVTGLVLPAHGPRPLADALVQVLSDRSRAAWMGAQARTRALEQHDWSASARLTRDLYARLISSS